MTHVLSFQDSSSDLDNDLNNLPDPIPLTRQDEANWGINNYSNSPIDFYSQNFPNELNEPNNSFNSNESNEPNEPNNSYQLTELEHHNFIIYYLRKRTRLRHNNRTNEIIYPYKNDGCQELVFQ